MLVLASASPRRHQLLLAAGIPHVVRPAHIPEVQQPGESPEDFVVRLAREKASAVVSAPDEIVLGADTTVNVDGAALGKPVDAAHAAAMLGRLSGRVHLVQTGVCLRRGAALTTALATTRVQFACLTDAEIDEYIQSGEGSDKAGSYAIQGLASRFVDCIEGSYHNVVGLPVSLVYRLLKQTSGLS